jgi:DNA-binding NtrC family response regulator
MGRASNNARSGNGVAEVEAMEKHDLRDTARDLTKGSPLARCALILNPKTFPCATNSCASLANALRRERLFEHIHESTGKVLPASFSFVPDVVIVRLPVPFEAEEMVASCKKKWCDASILVLVCPAIERLSRDFAALLRLADDFLSCPFQFSELSIRLRRILRSKRDGNSPEDALIGESRHGGPIVGESPGFLSVVAKISRVAECRDTLLISGETGTGKEVFSRAIHYRSARRGKPFVPVNCGALPDHLFENELFGHAKGAFTDASSSEKGLIAEAEGGTLFLDEIDTLSHAGQVKLLRFLQDGEYRPVGSARSVHGDVRVIAATNADLLKRVEAKQFREDLYYRLNALSLHIPSLRERIDDVVPLTAHFLDRYAQEHRSAVRTISSEAIDKLMGYAWPGNVRELESVIKRALTFARAAELQSDDIELPLSKALVAMPAESLRQAKNKAIMTFERRYVASLLARYRGNVTRAAKAAGTERRALQRLLRKHNLDRQSFQG